MRIAVVGAWIVSCLALAVLLAAVVPSVGRADRTLAPVVPKGASLIALATAAGEGRQQITVVDPETRVLGVYHIDLSSGEIALKSVRNIHWDLQMGEFNSMRPLPLEVRSMLEQK